MNKEPLDSRGAATSYNKKKDEIVLTETYEVSSICKVTLTKKEKKTTGKVSTVKHC